MAYQITWTPVGRQTFLDVVEYLRTSFSEREVSRFVNKVDEKIENILTNPNMYRKSLKVPHVHYTNIFGKVLLVYQVMPQKQTIVIVKFWNLKQNPSKFGY